MSARASPEAARRLRLDQMREHEFAANPSAVLRSSETRRAHADDQPGGSPCSSISTAGADNSNVSHELVHRDRRRCFAVSAPTMTGDLHDVHRRRYAMVQPPAVDPTSCAFEWVEPGLHGIVLDGERGGQTAIRQVGVAPSRVGRMVLSARTGRVGRWS